MPLYSMTGYGRSRQQTEFGSIDVEVKTINHRYADLNIKLPKDAHEIEERVKAQIAKRISRGRVNVNILFDPVGNQRSRMCIDKEAFEDHIKVFEELKYFYEVSGDIDLRLLAEFPDIFSRTVPSIDEDTFWHNLEPVLEGALSDCVKMREREGERIGLVVSERLSSIKALLAEIEKITPQRIERLREKLKKAVFSLMEGVAIDESRLMYEVSMIAERWDITEEIDRMNSHLALFKSYLEEGGVLGRRLTFLCQELHREANTISSKANDSLIVQKVVLIKEEVEKIREQLENLE
ncbi:MAG: YicC/YloC family endoribonuclease [Candidatus Glassbacteria bacterium]